MTRIVIALACLVGLAACTEVVAGNEMHVSVDTDWSEASALRKAEAHCGQYGRLARLNTASAGRYSYHCVRRDQ